MAAQQPLSLKSLMLRAWICIAAGCADPVRAARIESLGPDTESPGPDHRPGQPCLWCHAPGGPAASKPFAIAGTVYETSDPESKGAAGIYVQFTDAAGGTPRVVPQTTESGNFFLPTTDWPDLRFPIRVGLYKEINQEPLVVMKSLIGRDGSCNACHRANNDPSVDSRASAGQVYLTIGASP